MSISTSIAKKTRNAVLRSKKRVWTMQDFKTDKPLAVLRELSRLVEKGLLVRISKGIYCRPTHTPLGPAILSKEELGKFKVHRKGISMVPTGYTGFNAIGITTQVSPIMELAVEQPMRISNTEKSRIRFVVRNKRTLNNATERVILDALRRINHISDSTPTEVLIRVKQFIKSKKVSFDRLALLALQSEPPRVCALIGAIGEDLGVSKELLDRLYRSLNRTTKFKIPVAKALKNAKKWGICD